MTGIHAQCVTYGTDGATGTVHYVDGANLAGFIRVANAMLDQGL
jgi:glutamate dehydrogenase (NADP+)